MSDEETTPESTPAPESIPLPPIVQTALDAGVQPAAASVPEMEMPEPPPLAPATGVVDAPIKTTFTGDPDANPPLPTSLVS